MALQHKDIPDAQLHEPKGVAAAANKTTYVANGSGSGTWRKLKESDFDYTDVSSNIFGWNDIADNLYTVGSPRSVSANTRTKLTNNGLAAQTTQERLGTIWNTTNNQFNINDINSSYSLRVGMKVKAAAAASTPYVMKLELQSTNGSLVIASQDYFLKGGDYVNDRVAVFPFYMGSLVNNYPLELYVTADTNITLYNIGFVIQRLYKES